MWRQISVRSLERNGPSWSTGTDWLPNLARTSDLSPRGSVTASKGTWYWRSRRRTRPHSWHSAYWYRVGVAMGAARPARIDKVPDGGLGPLPASGVACPGVDDPGGAAGGGLDVPGALQ